MHNIVAFDHINLNQQIIQGPKEKDQHAQGKSWCMTPSPGSRPDTTTYRKTMLTAGRNTKNQVSVNENRLMGDTTTMAINTLEIHMISLNASFGKFEWEKWTGSSG